MSGINLYPQVWDHLAHLRNLKHHPYEFYQKLGYVIVGVMPDANGPGLARYSHGKAGRAMNGFLPCEDRRAWYAGEDLCQGFTPLPSLEYREVE